MAPDLQEQLLHAIEKIFNYNKLQAATVYVDLMVCMRKRQYITIYRMDDDDTAEQEDVDQAILRTLLRYVCIIEIRIISAMSIYPTVFFFNYSISWGEID
jgi:hypothetical protein